MTETTWKIGQLVYCGNGEYSTDRPADIDSPYRETEEEAIEDCRSWFGWLSEREKQSANCYVREFRVESVEEDGSIGVAISTQKQCWEIENDNN